MPSLTLNRLGVNPVWDMGKYTRSRNIFENREVHDEEKDAPEVVGNLIKNINSQGGLSNPELITHYPVRGI